MDKYELRIPKSVLKQIERLPEKIKGRVIDKILSLAAFPRPGGFRKLSARENIYRVRIGDYRVVYEIDDDKKVVIILKCLHRSEVYR